jgi:hypothetical protein
MPGALGVYRTHGATMQKVPILRGLKRASRGTDHQAYSVLGSNSPSCKACLAVLAAGLLGSLVMIIRSARS